MTKVIYDQDGLGEIDHNFYDWLVLLEAPGFDLLGMTTVSGREWSPRQVPRALRILEMLDRQEIAVAGFPLLNSPERSTGWEGAMGVCQMQGVISARGASVSGLSLPAKFLSPFPTRRPLGSVKTFLPPSAALSPESDLVARTLAGDRASYGTLVTRHQSAVAGVAYSICGDFSISEDLAQEAFVAAWRQLPELREPGRFRSWVCGIVRMLSLNYVRRRVRHGDDSPADATTIPAADASPLEAATSEEEKVLLWQTLSRLPENYREPLILFYREQQSVADVATALDVSEDVVKQRLARGRALLRDELATRLEGALFRTRPGSAFTVAVISALPTAVAATGAALSVGTAKAASAAGTTSSSGPAGVTAAGALAFFGSAASAAVGLLGLYVLYRTWRGANVEKAVRGPLFLAFAFSALIVVIFTAAFAATAYNEEIAAAVGLSTVAALTGLALGYVLLQTLVAVLTFVRLHTLMHSARLAREPALITWTAGFPARRYESRIRFLGLPLLAIAQGADSSRNESMGVARGWIAIGDIALGGMVGLGAISFAPISIAGIGVGIFSLSGLALGALALGGVSFGFLSCGGFAFGWDLAVGGAAFARELALGGIAVARDAALGGLAFASQANSADALQSVQAHPLHGAIFRWLPYAGVLSLLAVPSLVIALRHLHPCGTSSARRG